MYGEALCACLSIFYDNFGKISFSTFLAIAVMVKRELLATWGKCDNVN